MLTRRVDSRFLEYELASANTYLVPVSHATTPPTYRYILETSLLIPDMNARLYEVALEGGPSRNVLRIDAGVYGTAPAAPCLDGNLREHLMALRV